jgi:predicted NACHT family NTPase
MTQVLNSGRALVIFDGIDELPNVSRAEVRRRMLSIINLYPKNVYIATTRPSAVPTGWLSTADFYEVRVDSLTADERNELILKWYSSLEATGLYETTRLDGTARKLIAEIASVPAIAQIAVNPLLCAMTCALNIDRRGQLPRNQRDLCNALVEALLHRRDAEQRIQLEHFPERYADLTLTKKR